MRILYASETRFPSRASNSMQTMRMCAGFAAGGHHVTLVQLPTDGPPPEGFRGDVNAFYGIGPGVQREIIAGPGSRLTQRLEQRPAISRPLRAAAWARFFAHARLSRRPVDLLYTRSYLVAEVARRVWASLPCVIEAHDEPPASAWRNLEVAQGVVVISEVLRRRVADRLPELEDRLWVEHDGVDLAGVPPAVVDLARARANLGLPTDRPIAMYTGRVNEGKGVGVLLAASERFAPASNAHVVLVGKVYDEELQRSAPGATFTGFVPPSEVSSYLAVADVLVMPTTEELAYAAYTSPLKLFEYMAAGRPVVASSLASVREVLRDGENALLYPPDDADALAGAVSRLLDDPDLAARMAAQAAQDVREYAWNRRAERILSRL